MERCNHKWVYSHKSCCHVIKCDLCDKYQRTYHVKGDLPKTGDLIRILQDGETIEVANEKRRP